MSDLTYTPGHSTGTNHNNPIPPAPGALTREQVEEAIRLLKEKLPIEYWPGLVNLSDTDKYLREELRCEREAAVEVIKEALADAERRGLERAAGICEAEALIDDERGYYGKEMAKAIRLKADEIN